MKVKIGDKIYNSENQAIMIILEDYNKEDISNMDKDARKYCEFPNSMSEEEAIDFMRIEDYE